MGVERRPYQFADDHGIDEMLVLEPEMFDAAFVGTVERFGMEPVSLYDRAKIIEILVREGATEEEAEEHFGYNMIGAWVGDKTWAFVTFDDGFHR